MHLDVTKAYSKEEALKLFIRFFGFKVLKLNENEIISVLKENELRSIVKTKDNELFYLLKKIPLLSFQETVFLKALLNEIQLNNKKLFDLKSFLLSFAEKHLIVLDDEQENYFLDLLHAFISGLNAFYFFLQDNELEELSVLGIKKNVRVYHKAFGWLKTNIEYESNEAIIDLINRMALPSGKSISYSMPSLNTVLNDGSRLNANINPVTLNQANFTIRRFNFQRMTPLHLINNKTFSSELMAFLSLAINSDCSFIIAGNTGSGKTTSLNALFSFLPEEERIIVIEDTPEILLPQKHVLRFKSVEELNIGMHDLVFNSLRARPDRLILGEARNELHAHALINAMLSGQGKGCYATIHALNADDAIKRLKALKIKEIDLNAVDLLLIQKRISRINLKKKTRVEERKIIEVAEILQDESMIKLNKIFVFDFKKKRLKKVNESIKVKEKIMNAFSFNERQLEKELLKRTLFFEENKTRNLSLKEFHELLKEKGFLG